MRVLVQYYIWAHAVPFWAILWTFLQLVSHLRLWLSVVSRPILAWKRHESCHFMDMVKLLFCMGNIQDKILVLLWLFDSSHWSFPSLSLSTLMQNDKMKLLKAGSLQHLGENMLAFLLKGATSPYLPELRGRKAVGEMSKNPSIFFDILVMQKLEC